MRTLLLEVPDKHRVDVEDYGETVVLFPDGLQGRDFTDPARFVCKIVDRLEALDYDATKDTLVLAGSTLACVYFVWAASQVEGTIKVLSYTGGRYVPFELLPDTRPVEEY